MGEIHELFGLALSLVWFAGATPDREQRDQNLDERKPWLEMACLEASDGDSPSHSAKTSLDVIDA